MKFNVTWKGQSGIEKSLSFSTLDAAMTFSKTLGIVVTISNGDFEVVGKFGVDSIKNGKCPDGTVYDWNKASRIGATRRR